MTDTVISQEMLAVIVYHHRHFLFIPVKRNIAPLVNNGKLQILQLHDG